MKFEIKDRDAAGRICKLTTNHGIVTTPNLMPVINPNKMIISPKEMKKLFGTEIIITNSYIIKKDEKLRKKALNSGIHKLVNFDGPIMTDSGTFQSYVYGDINLDPLEIVEFQKNIGVDIGTILDVFCTPDKTKKEAIDGMDETIERAKKSTKIKDDMALACTVQGSIFTDLREKCAKSLSDIGADFFPIGGVVPLMENQRYSDLTKVILSSKRGLDLSKPVHLFGAGHPLVFPLAVALGCDFFDSSAYAKYAQDGRLIFPWGTEKLDNLEELPCCCPICSKYGASDLKKSDEKERIRNIALHNLYVSFMEIKKIRSAIKNGTLWELVERQACSNPYLFEALDELKREDSKGWLERFEPISKERAVFYTGNHTIHRPIFYRYNGRLLERYQTDYSDLVVFPEGKKPYSAFYSNEIQQITDKKNTDIIVKSSFGPAPIWLDEMYPIAQSVFPKNVDNETANLSRMFFDNFTKERNAHFWNGFQNLSELKNKEKNGFNIDIMRISNVADMQFVKGAGKMLLDGEVRVVKSKKTGKIRNIYVDDKHILSMRAGDGLFTLKKDGALILHKCFKKPHLRVVVNDDAVSFVKEGKSVFARFVKDCDINLRPYDECLIVDNNDYLLGIGRCLLNREEMLSFNYGMAVKNREAIK